MKNKRLGLFIATILVLTIYSLAFVNAEKLMEYNTGIPDYADQYYLPYQPAQVFTVGVVGQNVSFNLTKISFLLLRTGDAGNIYINITTADPSTGIPNVSEVLGHGFITQASVPNTVDYNWINVSMNGSNLEAGKTYAIFVELPNTDASNYYEWHIVNSNSYGIYPDDWIYTTDSGTSWTGSSRDSMFQVWSDLSDIKTNSTASLTIQNFANTNISSVIYGNSVNATCRTTGGTKLLLRNGIDITSLNGKTEILSASNYVFSCQALSDSNFNYAESNLTISVNKSSFISGFNISGTTPITYGTTSDFVAFETFTGDSDCVYSLSPSNSIYSAGLVLFNYSRNSCQNYTAQSITKLLTINQANGVVYTYIAGSNSNKNLTSNIPLSLDLNATLNNGVGNIQLYLDNVLINSGNPVGNTTTFSVSGFHNVTSIYSGNTNFTSNFQTFYLNFTIDNATPTIFITYPTNANYYPVVNHMDFIASHPDLASCWYSLNLGVTNISIDCHLNITGISANQGTNTWKVYANDSLGNVGSDSVTFTKDDLSPNINLIYPANLVTFNDTIIQFNYNLSNVALKNSTIYIYYSNGSLDKAITTSSGTFANVSHFANLDNGTFTWYVDAWDLTNNFNVSETRTFNILLPQEIINITIVPPTVSDGDNIRNVMASAGGGLASLISYLAIPLFLLLIGIAIAGIIMVIGGGLKSLLTKIHIGK